MNATTKIGLLVIVGVAADALDGQLFGPDDPVQVEESCGFGADDGQLRSFVQ